ncbi:MAG: 2-oxoacid:acceptor oxidoreductase subunit alpha [Fibrobacter sp.]|nr:2-oxoacid:acceptor oxidoreductase subunit alpha [Fibrobacter sp.]
MPHKLPIKIKIKISGEAGDGIASVGEILMKSAASLGYNATAYKSFPPNIRGGYSQSLVTISETPITSALSSFDMLFALNEAAFKIDSQKVGSGKLVAVESTVVNNQENCVAIEQLKKNKNSVFSVPVSGLANEISDNSQIRSAIVLGVIAFLLDMPESLILKTILRQFKHKGSKIHELNCKAVQTGRRWAAENFNEILSFKIPPLNNPADRVILDGNQAVGIGAIVSGCTFFASYPITPATTIGEFMAESLLHADGFAYQAEDEIAALGAVVGASFAGCKAMTATSGPGLSLMQEFIGYGSMVELPIVIVDVQRGGPSTGMPTKHAQDDLMAAVFGSHGESPRIVLAPINIQDCLEVTISAFNLAERYQCPVILLSDSSLGMINGTMEIPQITKEQITNRYVLSELSQKSFSRFEYTENGLNPIPVPGFSPCTYHVSGVEHDTKGTPSVDCETRVKQMEKRFRKIEFVETENESLVEWDLESQVYNADFSIISWGLTASASKEAVRNLREKGYKVAAIYPRLLYPVCRTAIEKLAQFSSLVIVPESNYTQQYAHLVRMYTSVCPVSFALSNGEPFTPDEIEAFCEQTLKPEFRIRK